MTKQKFKNVLTRVLTNEFFSNINYSKKSIINAIIFLQWCVSFDGGFYKNLHICISDIVIVIQ